MPLHRPVNLNLFTIKFPITAIASVLHRLSGFILFLLIPCLLGMLAFSLRSAAEFNQIKHLLNLPFLRVLFFLIYLALFYHLFAGIRHLFMDAEVGESLSAAKFSARLVMIAALVVAVSVGILL